MENVCGRDDDLRVGGFEPGYLVWKSRVLTTRLTGVGTCLYKCIAYGLYFDRICDMDIYIHTHIIFLLDWTCVFFLELEKNFQKLATFPRYPGGSGLSAYAGFFYWWCRFPRGSRDSGSTVAPRPTLPPCAQERKTSTKSLGLK